MEMRILSSTIHLSSSMRPRTLGVIPCRYGSTRFPGKPLALLHDKPIIWHTYTAASRAKRLDHVVVATDDQCIVDVVKGFGGNVIMTSATCPTGTDRVAEVVSQLEESFAIILNIQGDEPCIDPDHIDTVAALLQENETEIMGTAATRITSEQEAWDRNVVKCVVNIHGYALYFSRALIPHSKEGVFHPSTHYLRHLGIYAFRREFLLEFPHLPPCPIQEEESLEQLKVLYSGHRIRVAQVSTAAPGIDTREHLHRVERAGTQKE